MGMNFNYNTRVSNSQNTANSTIDLNQGTNNDTVQKDTPTSSNVPAAQMQPSVDSKALSSENLKPLNKDTVTLFGKEVSKKKAITSGIGGLAAIIGAATAIIYAIKRNKKIDVQTPLQPIALGRGRTQDISESATLLKGEPKEITPTEARAKKFIENSKEMLTSAKECKKRALKTSKQVEDTICNVEQMFKNNATKTADGRKVEIINNVMTEFADDATTIKRVSTFDNGTPKSIEEFIDATRRNLIEFNSQNKTISYKENLRQIATDSLHDKEVILYKGKLNRYIEGIKECANGDAHYKKMLDFNPNGKMDIYAEDCKYLSFCEKFTRRLDFTISSETLNGYTESLAKYTDGREFFMKNLSFTPGVNNPNTYTEKYKKMSDGSIKSSINLMFNKKGRVIGYEENSIDGIEKKWDKCFKLLQEKWYMEPSPK